MATYRIKRFSKWDPSEEQLEKIKNLEGERVKILKKNQLDNRVLGTAAGALAGLAGLSLIENKQGKSLDNPYLNIGSAVIPAIAVNRGMKYFQNKNLSKRRAEEREELIEKARYENKRQAALPLMYEKYKKFMPTRADRAEFFAYVDPEQDKEIWDSLGD